MRYRVGDKVRLRKDLIINSNINGLKYPEEMHYNLKDKSIEITAIHEVLKRYYVSDGKGYKWAINEGMIQHPVPSRYQKTFKED